MSNFHYVDDKFHADSLDALKISDQYGTPLHVYSESRIRQNCRAYMQAYSSLNALPCFAVKANASLAIARIIGSEGLGMDVSSRAELELALRAGVPGAQIIYTGLGKQPVDVLTALSHNIKFFVVESLQELEMLDVVGRNHSTRVPVVLRFNPDVNVETHPALSTGKKESQFGFTLEEILDAARRCMALHGVNLTGVHYHIGSQLLTAHPFEESAGLLLDLCCRMISLGANLRYLDLGGGIGIAYHGHESIVSVADLASMYQKTLGHLGCQFVVEPGRSIVGDAGIILSTVLYRKEHGGKRYVILDAGMNDLIRPALYGAYHRILPVRKDPYRLMEEVKIIGPVCECDDVFADERELQSLDRGDVVAICDTGAYGFSMSSTYNGRMRLREVLVTGDESSVIRERESLEDFFRLQQVPEHLK